ncbi:XRE family transcriptional regulator [Legionella sp. km772]|uniref:helix-turn-helix domain-containing protein n=1 Tax=Legionella sp. km772 TaxID=2498111 RepID=UPI000F8ED659|nr:XRE family transcriptional regulator [Legionella sp. km772]RUR10823.1 helix-turn-helix domain-containing protein [Legionella sp. km772]
MSIKEKIGLRIKQERTSKKLTMRALAELTDNLNISRINNYERGERTPGPEEIKQLAKALDVSPSFLMCLSDDRQGSFKTPGLGGLIPILDYKSACEPVLAIQKIKDELYSEKLDLVPINSDVQKRIGKNAFALLVKDESMLPELRFDDILIIDPDTQPSPGDFIVVKLESDVEVIIRKYKKLSASIDDPEVKLIALNNDWPEVMITKDFKKILMGTVISLFRTIKR